MTRTKVALRLWVTPEQKELVDKLARIRATTKSEVFRQMLEDWLAFVSKLNI